jgi:hypothetical protein
MNLQAIRGATPDLLLVCGAGCLSYGAWLLHPAAGFLVAGVLLLVGGYKLARVA